MSVLQPYYALAVRKPDKCGVDAEEMKMGETQVHQFQTDRRRDLFVALNQENDEDFEVMRLTGTHPIVGLAKDVAAVNNIGWPIVFK